METKARSFIKGGTGCLALFLVLALLALIFGGTVEIGWGSAVMLFIAGGIIGLVVNAIYQKGRRDASGGVGKPELERTPPPAVSQISPLPPFDQMVLDDGGDADGSGPTATATWQGHGVFRIRVVIPDLKSPIVRANYEAFRERWPELIETAIGEVAQLIREHDSEKHPPDPENDFFTFTVPTEPLSASPVWEFRINSKPAWVVDFAGMSFIGGQGVFDSSGAGHNLAS